MFPKGLGLRALSVRFNGFLKKGSFKVSARVPFRSPLRALKRFGFGFRWGDLGLGFWV